MCAVLNEVIKDPVLIDLPMPIVTPRLILRPVMPGDGAAAHEAKAESWDQLTRWMPWATGDFADHENSEVMAWRAYARFILREDLMMVGIARDSGRPVIWTGLHRFNWNFRRFEIGYWVRKSAQGQGYATESTNALARYAFAALAARRVEIVHSGENHASRRVIEKLGFRHEGVFYGDHVLPGAAVASDHWQYGLLSADTLPPLDVTWGGP